MSKNGKQLRKLKDLIGGERFREVMKGLQGERVYFSGYSGFITKDERDAAIKRDYFILDSDIPELAHKYDLTQSSIYKIIRKR